MKTSVVLLLGTAIAFVAATTWTVHASAQEQNTAPAASSSSEQKAMPKDSQASSSGKSEALPAADAADIAKQKAAYPLDTCVVTGEKFGNEGSPVDYVYKGRLVRFCCAGCIAAFEKNPGKYLAKLDAAAKDKEKSGRTTPKEKSAATVWTCSMHPEVHESKPGKCPKCGMDLVKASPPSSSDKK